MKIALPLNRQLILYHDNPCTAPKFAIYTIKGDKTHLTYSLSTIVDNPWFAQQCNAFGDDRVACNCDEECRKDIHHIFEHYTLLDSIGGCSYLLADRYCDNTSNVLKNGSIKVYKVPTIINDIDRAIKNFIVGAELANSIKQIHHAY